MKFLNNFLVLTLSVLSMALQASPAPAPAPVANPEANPVANANPNPSSNRNIDPALVEKDYLDAEPFIDHLTTETFQAFISSPPSSSSSSASSSFQTLVFYGAKWCIHCQQFTPIWLKFQTAIQQSPLYSSFLKVGKVECTLNMELCKDLEGYPTVFMYDDQGIQKEDLMERSLEGLLTYVEKLAKRQKSKEGKAFQLLKELSDSELSSSPESLPNPNGVVVDLTEADFDIKTNGTGWFIKFFAPWCGHCKQLAPVWDKLGENLKGKVNIGSVDCDQHGSLCKRHEVKGFPTLLFINSPEIKIPFSGARQLESMQDFALLQANQPSFKAVQAQDLPKLTKPKGAAVFFVYDGQTEDSATVRDYYAIAKSVKGKIPVYLCPEKKGWEMLGMKKAPNSATIVLYSDAGLVTNVYAPSGYSDDKGKAGILRWILANKDPLVAELDETTQSALTKSKHLLLTILDPDNPKDKKKLQSMVQIAQTYKFKHPMKPVKFAWLDGRKYSKYVKQVYDIDEVNLPVYVVSSPGDETFFAEHEDGKAYEFEEKSVFKALGDAQIEKGRIRSAKGYLGLFVFKTTKFLKSCWSIITQSYFSMASSLLAIVAFIYLFLIRPCLSPSTSYTKLSSQLKTD